MTAGVTNSLPITSSGGHGDPPLQQHAARPVYRTVVRNPASPPYWRPHTPIRVVPAIRGAGLHGHPAATLTPLWVGCIFGPRGIRGNSMKSAAIRSLVLFALSATIAFSQVTASLSGVITDETGASVPSARIALTNTDTGVSRDATSNETGLYQFPLLQPGTYSLAVQKDGFKQVTREGVRLEVNQAARIDFAMQVGAVTETVEVTGAAPLLESTTSSVGHIIDTKAVADLPLNGRNFVQLAILGPGVVGVGYSASGTIGSGTRPDDMRPGTELFSNGNR